MKNRRGTAILAAFLTVILIIGLSSLTSCANTSTRAPSRARTSEASVTSTTTTGEAAKKTAFPQTIRGLNQPVAMAFAPDRRIFITERVGRIRVFENSALEKQPFATVTVPRPIGYHETGLLGIALPANFKAQPYIYVYHTYRSGSTLFNRVVRFKDVAKPKAEVILDKIPAGRIHNGGVLAFGPDGNLYISTGETGDRQLAQDRTSLAGKILRVKPDGSIPTDNPFGDSPVYSLGHRNVFGMAFHPQTGVLYVTENGPAGDDEINRIEAGKNYGWPTVLGTSNDNRFVNPIKVYGSTIAPTQAIFYTGNVFRQIKDWFVFGTYVAQDLHALDLTGKDFDTVGQDKRILSSPRPIIGVAQSLDGDIYITDGNLIKRVSKIGFK
ncbi:MAG: PQQ-dependent sugar dehydrogenase [Candidatus Aquicultor sp.]